MMSNHLLNRVNIQRKQTRLQRYYLSCSKMLNVINRDEGLMTLDKDTSRKMNPAHLE